MLEHGKFVGSVMHTAVMEYAWDLAQDHASNQYTDRVGSQCMLQAVKDVGPWAQLHIRLPSKALCTCISGTCIGVVTCTSVQDRLYCIL